MRLREFNQTLDELKMSPGSLKAMASQVEGALVGLEFEMVVPGIEDPDDVPEYEPDYDYDSRIRATNWSDFEQAIYDFYLSGEFSSSRGEVKRALESANEDLLGFIDDQFTTEVEDGGFETWWEANEDGPAPKPEDGKFYDDEFEKYKDAWYQDAFDSSTIIQEWLELADAEMFSSFGSMYDLTWPYITEPEGGVGEDLQSLADDFGASVGFQVDVSDSYHGQSKSTKRFTIEPDSSIRGDGAGLEFVSPPLPLDKMIETLSDVIEWAKGRGCQTNKSTGLHMNVSVPNYDLEKLDYVKLALFVGDNWIAEQFGRLGNDYADSSIDKIKSTIKVNPDKVPAYLDAMRAGLAKIASRLIHSNHTQKYVTLNIQNNRLEFRSPGGDWLNQDIGKLTNTLLRFVVALDIACNPEKQKKEYDKKLYKLIMGNTLEGDPTIKMFALYSSGQLPKDILLQHLRRRKMARQDGDKEKSLFGDKDINWTVHYNPSETDYRERVARVLAKTKEEAVENFYQAVGTRVPVVLRVVPQG